MKIFSKGFYRWRRIIPKKALEVLIFLVTHTSKEGLHKSADLMLCKM